MIYPKILVQAINTIKKAGIDSARLDAELLLSHVLKIDRAKTLARDIPKLSANQKRRFLALIARRAKREPIAYLVGHQEFYGLNFLVNHSVLIPRPETELLVETVLNQLLITHYSLPITIIDIGTGSGAIATSLAKHLSKTKIFATDISAAALQVARQNAKLHKVKINFKKNDLLAVPRSSPLVPRGHLFMVANLPYLPTSLWKKTQPEIKKYEPRHALDGGPDGLKYYRHLLRQLKSSSFLATRSSLQLFFEIDPCQTKKIQKLILQSFPKAKIEIKKDLASRDRLVIASLFRYETTNFHEPTNF